MICLDVTLPHLSYPILIGSDALTQASERLVALCANGKATVITDETVWKLYGKKLKAFLLSISITPTVITLSPGEESKSILNLSKIYTELCKANIHRKDPIIAFGGGVVGDIAGFAASTYMRGIPFIQIPTTLLAQVDSSVGGKVAVNLPEGKNLVGSFYQPKLVIADTNCLNTLPKREILTGMAEVLKYAAIGEPELEPILSKRNYMEKIDQIVYLCCNRKAKFVMADERDTSVRMMLNFGHSFGHAIEKLTGYKKYTHGEAVAFGMPMAVKAGISLGITQNKTLETLLSYMDLLELSWKYPSNILDLIPLMTGDKKNIDHKLTLVLLEKWGVPRSHSVLQNELEELFLGQ